MIITMVDNNIIEYNLRCTCRQQIVKDIDEKNWYVYNFKYEIFEIKERTWEPYFRLVLMNEWLEDSVLLDRTFFTMQQADNFARGYIEWVKQVDFEEIFRWLTK